VTPLQIAILQNASEENLNKLKEIFDNSEEEIEGLNKSPTFSPSKGPKIWQPTAGQIEFQKQQAEANSGNKRTKEESATTDEDDCAVIVDDDDEAVEEPPAAKEPPQKKKKKGKKISIRLRDPNEPEPTFFTIKTTTNCLKIREKYCNAKGMDVDAFYISFDGDKCADEDTPESLDMDEMELLDLVKM